MSPKTLLLVEDNPDDEVLVMRAMRKSNVPANIIVAHDGVEALEVLGVDPPTSDGSMPLPTVVFLDLKMPRMGGLEVLRRLRNNERTRLLPVVVFTSSNEEGDIAESYRLGAASYLRKPVDYAELNTAVATAMTYWMGLNEPAPRKGQPAIDLQFAY